MKRIFFCLISVLMFVSCSDEIPQEQPGYSHDRTMLAYIMANETRLDDELKQNIVDMYAGLTAYGKAANLLVYYRPSMRYEEVFQEPTLMKFVSDGKGKVNGKPALSGDDLNLIEIYKQADKVFYNQYQNSASPRVMAEVLKEMVRQSPAASYGLTLGSHGSGWLPGYAADSRSFGQDGDYTINIPELADVLREVFDGNKLDFLLFDACMMANAEVFYELRDVTKYCVASVIETSVLGFPYDKLMPELYQEKVNYQKICDEFVELNRRRDLWGVLSAVDCSKMQPIADWVKQGLADADGAFAGDFYQTVQQYGRGIYTNYSFDLADFFRQLYGHEPAELLKLTEQAVVAMNGMFNMNRPGYPPMVDKARFCGIGMYIPYYPEKTKENINMNWDRYYESSIEWSKVVGWSRYRP